LGAAVVLVTLTRPWRRTWAVHEVRGAALLGLVIVAMNSCLYLAIDRIPLATGVTLELLGPLTLAVATSVSWRQRLWALPAAFGVALLGGSLSFRDLPGVVFALVAAVGWAAYIVLNRRMGGSAGLQGLGLATVAGVVVAVPIGIVTAGAALVRPETLAAGLAVGVLSAALPYSLDQVALRRLPTPVFGVLTSLNPAAAALAGAIILQDRLAPVALLGIAAVIIASAGAVISRSRPSPQREQPSLTSRQQKNLPILPSPISTSNPLTTADTRALAYQSLTGQRPQPITNGPRRYRHTRASEWLKGAQ
jgi:inner membrane transporter RhtA